MKNPGAFLAKFRLIRYENYESYSAWFCGRGLSVRVRQGRHECRCDQRFVQTCRQQSTGCPPTALADAKAELDKLNLLCSDPSWRSALELIERPELRPANYADMGEATSMLEMRKGRLAALGIKVKWNSDKKIYDVDNAAEDPFKTIVDPVSGQYASVDPNREIVTLKDKSGKVLWSTNIAEVLKSIPGGRLSGRKIQRLKLQEGALWADLVRGWAVIDIKTGAVGIASN